MWWLRCRIGVALGEPRTPDIGTKSRCVVFRSFDPENAIRVRGFCQCDALHTQRLVTHSRRTTSQYFEETMGMSGGLEVAGRLHGPSVVRVFLSLTPNFSWVNHAPAAVQPLQRFPLTSDLLTYQWFPRNTEKFFGGSVSQVFACAKRRTGRIPARETHSRGQNCGKLRNGISCLCQEF